MFCWHASYFLPLCSKFILCCQLCEMDMDPLNMFSSQLDAMLCQQRALKKHHRRKSVFPDSWWLAGWPAFSPLLCPVLVAGGLQFSLAFISPTAFPVFDWVCGGITRSPRQACALLTSLLSAPSPQHGACALRGPCGLAIWWATCLAFVPCCLKGATEPNHTELS